MKFELTDLELVDIGPNLIKIGPEMAILEQFSKKVQNTSILTELRYALKLSDENMAIWTIL